MCPGKGKDYDEKEVSKHLSQFCSIGAEEDTRTRKTFNTITVEKRSLGIKRLGMVDFLVNHCNYRLFFR